MSKNYPNYVTTTCRIPEVEYGELKILSLLRHETINMTLMAHEILFPKESDDLFLQQLGVVPVIDKPDAMNLVPLTLKMNSWSNISGLRRIAKVREVSQERLCQSVLAGYLATGEVRVEMVSGLNRLSVEFAQMAVILDTNYEQRQ